MSERTKEQDEAVVFAHNIDKISTMIAEYQSYVQTIQICQNRKNMAAKNEAGKIKSDLDRELKAWDDHIAKNQKEADERLEAVSRAYQSIKALFTTT